MFFMAFANYKGRKNTEPELLDDEGYSSLEEEEESSLLGNSNDKVKPESLEALYGGFMVYSFILGVMDCIEDLDQYIMYFSITAWRGCDFTAEYGVMLMSYNIVQMIWWPLVGYIIDLPALQRKGRMLMMVRCVSFVYIFDCIWLLWTRDILSYYIAYNLKFVLINLSWAACWKMFRMEITTRIAGTNLEGFKLTAEEASELILNKTSSRGDVMSQYSLTIMTVTSFFLISEYFELSKWFIYGSQMAMALAIMVLSILLQSPPALLEETMQPVDSRSSVTKIVDGCSTFVEKLRFFFGNKMVWNSLTHSTMISCILAYLNGPVNLLLAQQFSVADGFCDGLVYNLLFQACIAEVTYLIMGPINLRYISSMEPAKYYTKVYPVVCLYMIAVVISSNFKYDPYVQLTLSSIAACTCYYLYSFDYYVLFAETPDEHTGFITSLYEIVCMVVQLVPAAALSEDADLQTASIATVAICIVTFLQSFYIANLFTQRKSLARKDSVNE